MTDKKKGFSIFSSLKKQYYTEKDEDNNSNTLHILSEDNEMKMVIQKINKKSQKTISTRIKALHKMQEILEKKSPDYFDRFLKLFLIIYEKLVLAEKDKDVLYEIQKVVGVYLKKNNKTFKKNFKLTFPLLFLSTFEDVSGVRELADKNLGSLLKDDSKIAKAIFLFKSQYFELIAPFIEKDSNHMEKISIYKDKKTDETIYNKIRQMCINSMAKAVELSKYLKENERELLIKELCEFILPEKNKKKSALLFNLFKNAKFNYIIKSAVVNFISQIFKMKCENYLKSNIKNAIKLFLVEKLDEPTENVQKYYWQNNLIFNLINKAEELKIDINGAEKKLLNLVSNFGFGSGEPYYKSLPLLISKIYKNKNFRKSIAKIKRLILAHFESLSSDRLKFAIDLHFNCGFNIIFNTLESRKEKTDEIEILVESEIPELLLSITEIYLENNNSLQRNLLVLGVNNIKHFCPQICEFMKKLENKGFKKINENYCKLLEEFLNENSREILEDSNMTRSLAILNSQFLLNCEVEKNTYFFQFVKTIFGFFEINYNNINLSLTDLNFLEEIKVLENINIFFKEVFQKKYKNIFDKNIDVKNLFKNFIEKSKLFYNDYLIDLKIKEQIYDEENLLKFFEFQNCLVKTFYNYDDYENILINFNNKLDDSFSFNNKYFIENLFIFFSEKKQLLRYKTNLNSKKKKKDTINCILKQNFWGDKRFLKKIIMNKNFEKITKKLIFLVFEKNSTEFFLILTSFISLNSNLVKIASSEFIEILKKKTVKIDDLFDIFIYFTTDLFNLTTNEDILTNLSMIFVNLLKRDLTFTFEELVESIKRIKKNKLIKMFGFISLFVFEKKQLNSNILIFLQSFIEKYINTNYSKLKNEIEEIFYNIFEITLETLNQTEDYKEFLRKLLKKTKNFSLDKILERLIIQSKNKNNLLPLFEQPTKVENFIVNKKRFFWKNLVNEDICQVLYNLYLGKNEKMIEDLICLISEKSVKNVYLLNFLDNLLNLFFKNKLSEDKKKNIIFLVFETFLKNKESEEFYFAFEKIIKSLNKDFLLTIWDEFSKNDKFKNSPLIQILLFLVQHQKNLFKDSVKIENWDSEEKKEEILTNSFIKILEEIEKLQYNESLKRYLFLQTIDISLLKDIDLILSSNIENLEKFILEIIQNAENLFIKKYSQNLFYYLLIILRRLIPVLELFSEKISKDLLLKILSISFKISSNLKYNKFIYTISPEIFINEIAETISRFALQEKTSLKLNDIINLLEIEVNSIKKSIFFLLRQFKDPLVLAENVMESDEEEIIFDISCLSTFPLKIQELFIKPNTFDNFSFFLYWRYLFLVIDSTTEVENKNLKSLKFIFDNEPDFYMELLDKVLLFLERKRYTDSELLELVRKTNYLNPEKYWGDFVTEKTKESLALFLLFSFATFFPRYLKKWLELNKRKFSSLALFLLKNGINRKIFEAQVDKIELTQNEWHSDEFNVYINTKAKEIIIIYTQDEAIIELTITIPDNYPVENVDVKMNKKAKLPTKTILKFTLLFKKLLNSKNCSIVESIVKWKKNLDLEYSGIEPCPICYYILQPGSNNVPRKPCKTCHHKFHSKCIFKWFKSSGKSECPLCKSQFL